MRPNVIVIDEAGTEVAEMRRVFEEHVKGVLVVCKGSGRVEDLLPRAAWCTHCVVHEVGGDDVPPLVAACLIVGAQVMACAQFVEAAVGGRLRRPAAALSPPRRRHVPRFTVEHPHGGTPEDRRRRDFLLSVASLSCGPPDQSASPYQPLSWSAFVRWLWTNEPLSSLVPTTPPKPRKRVAFAATPGGGVVQQTHLLTPRSGMLRKVKRGKKGVRQGGKEGEANFDNRFDVALPSPPQLLTFD